MYNFHSFVFEMNELNFKYNFVCDKFGIYILLVNVLAIDIKIIFNKLSTKIL